jgi:hypothetical protein
VNQQTLAEIRRFHETVQRIALAAAQEIFQREFERNLAELRTKMQPRNAGLGSAGRATVSRRQRPLREEKTPAGAVQLGLPLIGEPTATSQAQNERTPSPEKRGRAKWTRETIVDELARWMIGGAAIDGAFMTRHGPPGLTAAARRIFGRFDAALNVAALEVPRQYPDGAPERHAVDVQTRRRASTPSTRARRAKATEPGTASLWPSSPPTHAG